jgi:hypothetical protein
MGVLCMAYNHKTRRQVLNPERERERERERVRERVRKRERERERERANHVEQVYESKKICLLASASNSRRAICRVPSK